MVQRQWSNVFLFGPPSVVQRLSLWTSVSGPPTVILRRWTSISGPALVVQRQWSSISDPPSVVPVSGPLSVVLRQWSPVSGPISVVLRQWSSVSRYAVACCAGFSKGVSTAHWFGELGRSAVHRGPSRRCAPEWAWAPHIDHRLCTGPNRIRRRRQPSSCLVARCELVSNIYVALLKIPGRSASNCCWNLIEVFIFISIPR